MFVYYLSRFSVYIHVCLSLCHWLLPFSIIEYGSRIKLICPTPVPNHRCPLTRALRFCNMAAINGARDGAEPDKSANQDARDSQDAHDSQDVTNVSDPNTQQNVPATASVQNATINVKLSDGRTLIINTILTFCVAAMSNALKMNVIQLIVMKFSEDEVVEPFVPPGLSTYSNALMSRPPPSSHCMQIDDTG